MNSQKKFTPFSELPTEFSGSVSPDGNEIDIKIHHKGQLLVVFIDFKNGLASFLNENGERVMFAESDAPVFEVAPTSKKTTPIPFPKPGIVRSLPTTKVLGTNKANTPKKKEVGKKARKLAWFLERPKPIAPAELSRTLLAALSSEIGLDNAKKVMGYIGDLVNEFMNKNPRLCTGKYVKLCHLAHMLKDEKLIPKGKYRPEGNVPATVFAYLSHLMETCVEELRKRETKKRKKK